MTDYETGFMRPPKSTRFKPGQSGNPKGRPKGSKGYKDIVKDVLYEQVKVSKGDKTVRMPKIRVVLEKETARAMNGNTKSAATVLGVAERLDEKDERMTQIKEYIYQDDIQIIKQFMEDNKNE